MLASNNFNITIEKPVDTGKKQFYQTVETGLSAYIEQVQAEYAPAFNADTAYSLHRIFIAFERLLDGSIRPDVGAGYRIIDDEGKEYAVEGVQPFKNPEIPDHVEIIANLKEM